MTKETCRNLGIILFIATTIYVLIPMALGEYRYRIQFQSIVSFILLTLWVGYGVYAAVRAATNAIRESARRGSMALAAVGGTVAVLALVICFFLGAVALAIKAESITEREQFDNGVMLLSRSSISEGDGYDIYVMKVGPLFYRKMTAEEEFAYGITQPQKSVNKHFGTPRTVESNVQKVPAQPTQEDTDYLMRCGELSAIYHTLSTPANFRSRQMRQ